MYVSIPGGTRSGINPSRVVFGSGLLDGLAGNHLSVLRNAEDAQRVLWKMLVSQLYNPKFAQ